MNEIKTASKSTELRGADKKEAFHQEAESRVQTYSFKRPEDKPKDKRGHFWIGRTDVMRGIVQMIPKGGDINLHYHPGLDGFWMVLQGKARFYGPEEKIIGEFGPHEGVLMPRNARYWFENALEDEELHILLVTGAHGENKRGKVDVKKVDTGRESAIRYNYPEDDKFGDPQKV